MIVVHIIARFNVGGTATWLSSLSKALSGLNHRSIILTGNCQFGEEEDSRLLELEHIKISNLGRKISPIADLRSLFFIRSQIKAIKPNVVNTHTAKAGVLGRLAVLSLGANRPALVHTVHGHLLTGYFSRWKVAIIKLVEKRMSKSTDIVLFAGKNVRDEMISVGACTSDKARVVYPGVEFTPSRKRVEETNENAPLVVGWLGRVTKVKRLDRLVELARLLPQYLFLIGGDGELMKELQESAPINCRFLGWTHQNDFWPMIDIGLLTSDNEAVAISIIEASLHGIPTVATNVGGVNEAIEDSKTGILCNSDLSSLRDAILRLGGSVELRREMGLQAKKYASNTFSVEKQAETHLAFYHEAIEIHREKVLD